MFDRCFSTKRIVLFVAIEALFHFITLIQAGCQTNVLQSGNLLYVLSKDQREFVAASNQCVAMGGKLSNIEGPRVDYISKMNSIYRTRDLTTVEIYEYGVNYKYLINGYDGYGSKDTSFPKFKLYTTPKSAYNAKFVFCKADYNWYYHLYQKWSVQTTSCTHGWTHDFTLYGGEKDRGTKPVYRYRNSKYSVRLSLSDEPSGDFTTRFPTLYIPDIRVQTGIQSDVNQSHWLSDNRVVNSFSFHLPPANKDKCQQLALRYNDVDWVTSAVECGSTTAYYYMCQIKFSIQVKPIQCNGTSILVSWNPNLYKNIFPEASKFPVRVYVKDIDRINTFTTQGKIIFSNLKPRTQYRINAYVWPCSSAIISNYVYVTTSYGKPDAITAAYVVSQPGSGVCTIDWPRDYHNGNMTSYEIVANNQFNSSIKINVTSWLFEMGRSNNGSTRYTIPSELLTIYGYSKNISFQIIAYSCEGASIPMSVNGYCVVVPDEVPPTASPRVEISVVVLPVVGLLLLFAIVGLLGYRKRNHKFHPSQKEVLENAVTSTQSPSSVSPAMKNGLENVSQTIAQPVHKKQANNLHLEETSVYENFASNNHKDRLHVNELEHFFMTSVANGFLGIRDEFKTIKAGSANKPHEVAEMEENKNKNRYKNIYPFDDSRVVLKRSEDYINASYIEGYAGRKTYIATQGAKDRTIADFWQMVWEQNSSVIVMLCKLKEDSKVKCSAYWPVQGSTVTHGKFTIKTTFEDDLGWVITRKFYVTSSQENREIFHFQLVSWPDHSVPTATSPLMYLRRMIKEATDDEPNQPLIVHCSAGAGRTGTFIAMDILFDQLDQTSVVDVPGAVTRMRERRVDMVQTADQYVLVYKLLVEHAVYKDTDISAPDYLELSRQSDWNHRIENEFRLFLRFAFEKKTPATKQDTNFSFTGGFNQMTSSKLESAWINATKLERISSFSGNIFAADGPAYANEAQFWNFVADVNASVLVCLETLEVDAVLRSKQGTQSQIPNSDKILSVDKIQRNDGLVERKITLSSTHKLMKLVHLHAEKWISGRAPLDGTCLINAINKLQSLIEPNSAVIIYCRDGCIRTGTFIAVLNLIERLKSENRIDVFRTIKDLRDMRANMVNNLDFYKLCYKVMEIYLKDFQTYGNFQ